MSPTSYLLNKCMLVLGNGESRKNIDVGSLTGVKVGCNAILRDYRVDHLICVDKRMVKEAIETGYNQHTYIYTRTNWLEQFNGNEHIRAVPRLLEEGAQKQDDPFHWGSGPYAVLLGAKLSKGETVNLLGFDLYSSTGNTNNIYKDTANYNESFKKAVDPRFWIYQIGKVFEWYPSIDFKIYTLEDWIVPLAWNRPNITVDNISNIV